MSIQEKEEAIIAYKTLGFNKGGTFQDGGTQEFVKMLTDNSWLEVTDYRFNHVTNEDRVVFTRVIWDGVNKKTTVEPLYEGMYSHTFTYVTNHKS